MLVGRPCPPCRPAPADCPGRERAAGAPSPTAARSSAHLRSDHKAGPQGAPRRCLRSSSRPARPPAPPLPPVSGGCCPPRLSPERGLLGRACPAAAFLTRSLPPALPVEAVDLRSFCGKEARSASEPVSYPQWREGLCAALVRGYADRLNVVCVITMVLIRAEDA